ncbi:biotin synthetase (Biotin synthase) [Magnetospirillum gryphiswaldense MSR-1 v2]|uniref:Biotin synthase n=1 Tax=Magnetospirillum gryphiswaldense (strain DSM 6361 / JCM 21280 / NBRC 15271 / MSR-1) TaxID=431944 RepID=V6F0X3_MAGGM|nr:biotin synthetase (Biotin synthase) [Magnetospirillum gryphiswaldense MSR-1 v2]
MNQAAQIKPLGDGLRHDWQAEEVQAFFSMPFMDLMFQAQQVHRANFDANKIQVSRLISIKTGSCPEDCTYCPQSAHYATGLEKEKLMAVEEVVAAARQAKEEGASRFCMGAAWRGPKGDDFEVAVAMIEGVKALGMQTCATFGLLDKWQAQRLKDAGLDYYNHNIDTSPEHYKEVITTRTFQDRLDTLDTVREVGLHVCSGGIVGLGETNNDRAKMLLTLANMEKHPDSVPINLLIAIPGTPLENAEKPDNFDFIRTIAAARIMMPQSYVRLSAGREGMSEEMQALCFMAGANSIFCGHKLLTAKNAAPGSDKSLFGRLGLSPL